MLLTMESKTAAYHKLETLIERGRTTASDVVDYVMNNPQWEISLQTHKYLNIP